MSQNDFTSKVLHFLCKGKIKFLKEFYYKFIRCEGALRSKREERTLERNSIGVHRTCVRGITREKI